MSIINETLNVVDNKRQLKTIFPKHSLRYKLSATLNEIPDSVLAEARNQSQKQFIDRARYWLNIVLHVLIIIVMLVRFNH